MNYQSLIKFSVIIFSLIILNACGGGGGGSKASFSLNTTSIKWTTNIYDSVPQSKVVTGSATNVKKSVYIVADSRDASFVESMQVTYLDNETGTLTINPRSPQEIGYGTHTGTIKVSLCYDTSCSKHVPGSPKTISAEYIVNYDIVMENSDIAFYSKKGTVNSHQEKVSFLAQDLDWQITNVPSWINISPLSGSGNSEITISLNDDNSIAGTKSNTFTISSDAQQVTKQISVSNHVDDVQIYPNRPVMSFSELGTEKPFTQSIKIMTNLDTNSLWQIQSKSDWITTDIIEGVTGDSVNVGILDTNTLSEGQHEGEIIFQNSDGTSTFNIRVGYYKNLSILPSVEFRIESVLGLDIFSPFKPEKITIDQQGQLKIINYYSGEEVSSYPLPENFLPSSNMTISPDAKHIFIRGSESGEQAIYRFSFSDSSFVRLKTTEQLGKTYYKLKSFYLEGKSLAGVIHIVSNPDADSQDIVIYNTESTNEIWRYTTYRSDINMINDGKFLFQYKSVIKSTDSTIYPLDRYLAGFNYVSNSFYAIPISPLTLPFNISTQKGIFSSEHKLMAAGIYNSSIYDVSGDIPIKINTANPSQFGTQVAIFDNSTDINKARILYIYSNYTNSFYIKNLSTSNLTSFYTTSFLYYDTYTPLQISADKKYLIIGSEGFIKLDPIPDAGAPAPEPPPEPGI